MRLLSSEPCDRVAVTVTFLRMSRPPPEPAPALPPEARVIEQVDCSVARFRELYDGVGADYLWWLRRTMPDRDLAAHLAEGGVSIHVLELDGETAGFYELDRRIWPVVNLAYFGLMPHAVGRGLGLAFLRHAIDLAWSWGPQALTVNTCTADHPRALPTYIRTGFVPVRRVDEIWNVPRRLGLAIPAGLPRA